MAPKRKRRTAEGNVNRRRSVRRVNFSAAERRARSDRAKQAKRQEDGRFMDSDGAVNTSSDGIRHKVAGSGAPEKPRATSRREAQATEGGLHVESFQEARAREAARVGARKGDLSDEFQDILNDPNVPAADKASIKAAIKQSRRTKADRHRSGTELEDKMIVGSGDAIDRSADIARLKVLADLNRFVYTDDEHREPPRKIMKAVVKRGHNLKKQTATEGVIIPKYDYRQEPSRMSTENIGGRRAKVSLIKDSEIEKLAVMIAASHLPTATPEQRKQLAEKARANIQKLAQEVEARHRHQSLKVENFNQVTERRTNEAAEMRGVAPGERTAVRDARRVGRINSERATRGTNKNGEPTLTVGGRTYDISERVRTQRDQRLLGVNSIEDSLAGSYRLDQKLKEGAMHNPDTGKPLTRGERLKRRIRNNPSVEATRNKITNARNGNLSVGLDSRGSFTGDIERAAIRVSPNKAWRYVTRDADDPLIEREEILPYWDQKSRVKGDILYQDQIKVQDEGFSVSLGARTHRDPSLESQDLPKWASEEVIVPKSGISRRSSKREKIASDDPDAETFEIKQVQTVNGRWVDATPAEFAEASSIVERDPVTNKAVRHSAPHRTVRVPKQRIVTYVPLDDVKRAAGERDDVTFNVRDRLVDIDVGQLGGGQIGDAAYRYKTVRDARENQASHNLEGWQKERRAGGIFAAGVSSAYYTTRKRTVKGTGPQAFNRAWEKGMNADNPVSKWARGTTLSDFKMDVDEAFVRPGVERVANFGWQVKHPFSSPRGQTVGGIDVGAAWARESKLSKLIPLDKDKAASRQVRRTAAGIDRVTKTEQFIDANAYKQGPLGFVARHRSEPRARWRDYQNIYSEGGIMDKARKEAQDILDSDSGPLAKAEARKLLGKTNAARAKNVKDYYEDVTSSSSGGIVPFEKAKSFNIPNELTPTSKKMLIGGAAVGTAVGAHYAYHKYKQRKLDPADREAYYNKVIPGPISTLTPRIRTTGTYRISDNAFTREFGLADRKMPVEFGVGLEKKTIWKGSPADRGYAKNASTGITKIRSGRTKGGSLKDSVAFRWDQSGKRRRSSVREGGQLEVRGRKLPVAVSVGPREVSRLSRTNPNALSRKDMDDIVWAFTRPGTSKVDREAVRQFYGPDHPITKTLNDPDAIRRIQKNRGDDFRTGMEQNKIPLRSFVNSSSNRSIDDMINETDKKLKELKREKFLGETSNEDDVFFSTIKSVSGM